MNLKIENNVPIPTRAGNSTALTETLTKIAVGDSVFVQDANQVSVAGCALYAGRKTGRKFTYRTVEGGFRVWRTA